MNAAQHTAQRDAVRASLACTHHPDVYGARSNSRTGDHTRPADDVRVSAVPSRTSPSHGARPANSGAVAREAGHPTHCAGCGRRWGLLTSDRYMSGAPSWNGSVCPACEWDDDCRPRQIPNSRRAS